jgi:hypothetical protein
MKMYGGLEIWPHTFLTTALEGREWSVSRPGRITVRKRDPSTHWIGGWVGPIVGLNHKENNLRSRHVFVFRVQEEKEIDNDRGRKERRKKERKKGKMEREN